MSEPIREANLRAAAYYEGWHAGRADLLAQQAKAEPLQALAAEIIAKQKPMPADMAAILARNMHRLYDSGSPAHPAQPERLTDEQIDSCWPSVSAGSLPRASRSTSA
jgi:hypothetical protein